MKAIQKGFTLIELMIVVAIIAILAAIALPAYQDYTKRSRVSEAVTLAGGAKTAVAEYFSNENAWPSDIKEAGIASKSTDVKGKAVKSLEVRNGVIVVTLSDKVKDNETIQFTPSAKGTVPSQILPGSAQGDSNGTAGSFTWRCDASDGMKKAWVPTECRHKTKTAAATTGGNG